MLQNSVLQVEVKKVQEKVEEVDEDYVPSEAEENDD